MQLLIYKLQKYLMKIYLNNLKKYLTVIYEKQKRQNYSNNYNKLISKVSFCKSFIPRKLAPAKAGIESKNEILPVNSIKI